jgi:hypothetical protein
LLGRKHRIKVQIPKPEVPTAMNLPMQGDEIPTYLKENAQDVQR